jgi:hypothetical protein
MFQNIIEAICLSIQNVHSSAGMRHATILQPLTQRHFSSQLLQASQPARGENYSVVQSITFITSSMGKI